MGRLLHGSSVRNLSLFFLLGRLITTFRANQNSVCRIAERHVHSDFEFRERAQCILVSAIFQLLDLVLDSFDCSAPTDLPPETRCRLIESLDSWNFEPHKLPDEEVVACTMILFEALFRIEGMEETIGISMSTYHFRIQVFRP